MAIQLGVHQTAAIRKAFAMHYGRDLIPVPEPVQVEEEIASDNGAQAFNLNFRLTFSVEPLTSKQFQSHVCGILPNNFGPDLFITVEKESLNLLLVESMFLEAAPLREYGQHVAAVQPWLQRCLASDQIGRAHGVSDTALRTLRQCTSDLSRFDMLRLMIIGDHLCFFGQIGARASFKTMVDVNTFSEPGRQLSIRMGDGGALAIDGFATVPVTWTSDKVAWIREDAPTQ